MSIQLQRLCVTGPDREPAELLFAGRSYLVFGPTDTGKSYVLESLRYGLGSSGKPRENQFSAGYTRLALQLKSADGEELTFFRDLVDGSEAVCDGYHQTPPQGAVPGGKPRKIAGVLAQLCGASEKRILVKAGKREGLAAGDLRHFSLFDEIETLDLKPLVGTDTNLLTRRRASGAVILTGHDDEGLTLVASAAKRASAGGYVEAVDEELATLNARLPKDVSLSNVLEAMAKLDTRIQELQTFLRSNENALNELKRGRLHLQREVRRIANERIALTEARTRFELLREKYSSDLQRLEAVETAASLMDAFAPQPCPLCDTPLVVQSRHVHAENDSFALMAEAARAESQKISHLQHGLASAIRELDDDIESLTVDLREVRKREEDNLAEQDALFAKSPGADGVGLSVLATQRTEWALVLRDLDRVDVLVKRREEYSQLGKRKTQTVVRNVAEDAVSVCNRIKALLSEWGVPGVEAVHFDEKNVDIQINQRNRISFGKGKRGIFLTAYVVALMEHALQSGNPHLGFVAVDSPVVTYKDPKHGGKGEELLDTTVADRFYEWLAARQEPGQVIVLENEEPSTALLEQIPYTEFIGESGGAGRRGFFPS
ncbi:hypothetical protein BJG93_00575 [Paraburkholderia sprentiae WSM5005]|uniref:Rad50/SbcC-type AAA domain-containing protein n=1 Tax=Paraburkholderia sprentiae WSM5005 TaxID=754502 RepID=A0A1I9YCM8_9BURK|nr:hypothetical protein [Paraburkholderia sprentiae]APA84061.1 hypothetical protein BJG93_00575 [Paraburkholderia sprentiae WSM5005]